MAPPAPASQLNAARCYYDWIKVSLLYTDRYKETNQDLNQHMLLCGVHRHLKGTKWLNTFMYSSHTLTRQLHFLCKWSHVWCWGGVWSKDRSGWLSCGGKRPNKNIDHRGKKVPSLANNCKALSDQRNVENIWFGPIKFIFPLKGEGRTRLDRPLMNTEEISHHKYHVTRN